MFWGYVRNESTSPDFMDLVGKSFTCGNLKCTVTDANLEYITNFALRTIVKRIATDISNLKPIMEDNETHPFMKIVKKPNYLDTWRTFIRDVCSRYLLDATVYIKLMLENSGEINSMFCIPKRDVYIEEININSGDIEKYRINEYSGYISIKHYNNQIRDKRNRIIKISDFNSKSRFPCILPENNVISLCNQLKYLKLAEEYNRSYLQKGAKPSYAIKYESVNGVYRPLSEEQKKDLRKAFIDNFSGAENIGNPIILQDGISLEQIDSDIDKLNFDELIEFAITSLCMVFGVPVEVVGYSKDSNGGAYKVNEDIRKSYYNNTIIPLGEFLYENIEDAVMFRYNKNGHFTFNKTLINTIMRDRFEILEIASRTDSLTVNELRKLAGLDPIDQDEEIGNSIYLSTGKMPVNYITKNATTREAVRAEGELMKKQAKAGVITNNGGANGSNTTK